ncbi:hypothetical protein C0Q70_10351 [Pomacea canaliculata]|uniref:KY-like immunoglobulin-like domain-containing protein n=1 Tax=Pomacea canaliculata TaxID=400727 RepID=A0A2T7PCD1_POMCA|nr:hypothetical protein C0Q70_10351 [Pomacea canaliculata]
MHRRMQRGRVEIIIGTTTETRVTSKLLSHERKQDVSDFALVRCLGPSYCFLIRPPAPGFYKFQIYALPSGEAGPNMIGVYNYLIHCPNTAQEKEREAGYWIVTNCEEEEKSGRVRPEKCYNPAQTVPDVEGRRMLPQRTLGIPRGYRGPPLRFRLNIPGARDVQVKIDEDWNQLEQVEPGIFDGLVDFSKSYPPNTKVKVNVKSGGNKYNTLLEYTI